MRHIRDDYKGLEFDGKLSLGQWKKLFVVIGKLHRMALFYLGDAIIECEKQLGEKAPHVIEAVGTSVSQAEEAVRVARRFRPDERYAELGFSVHRDAGHDRAIAVPLLKATARNRWSREQMRRARRELVGRVR